MTIPEALREFGETVRLKMSAQVLGEPEDQLRGPFENLMGAVAPALGWNVVCTGETRLPDRLGRPDYAIHLNGLLAGYVELKAPRVGAEPTRYSGRNREQWKRFRHIPNLVYCDGNEWGLYRDGKPVDRVVRLSGDIVTHGGKAITDDDALRIERLIRNFLSWEPFIPTDRKGKIDLRGLAELLAPLCRMLRDDVTEALRYADSPLVELAKDWRQLLFPDASDKQFADSYAQTVTFALLLSRSEGADPLTPAAARDVLAVQHGLLSRALQVLTDPAAAGEMAASLDLLVRVMAVIPVESLSGPKQPWLYFYEDFLAVYDPKLRKDAGAYYTPVEVVKAQVRLIDDLLVNRLGMPGGFADPGVVTLDPATGTGTYLLGVIEHTLDRVEMEQGPGAVPGMASALAENLYGFEVMVGPYSVAETRVSRALRDRGALLPEGGTHIYLTDTLESPYTKPPQLPLFLRPIAKQHTEALNVKSNIPVIVCLGNPPYDRHEAANGNNRARTGGWVRWGDDNKGAQAILRDFLDPAAAAGHGVHAKNIYNLYVYFWRWALWKVFEHETSRGSGVVSFITASSYLDGDAFCGMREHMRRMCDEIRIIDLGGEGRGTRQSDNVFDIRTPVAIAIAFRSGKVNREKPASVYYTRIEGSRTGKLHALDRITDLIGSNWRRCPEEWQAPFLPAGKGLYFHWPLLADIMPWQHSGVECKRTWPVGPDPGTLKRRWVGLLNSSDRGAALRETSDRLVGGKYLPLARAGGESSEPIAALHRDTPPPPVKGYQFRSFDRQCIIADTRLISRPRPVLWLIHGPNQLYLTTLLNHPLGAGPAVTCGSNIPDRHHFRGSFGGKDVFPLYPSRDAATSNVAPGLLDLLGNRYGSLPTVEDLAGYLYGILAHPCFTRRYAKELETRELRVPITKDATLFSKVRDVGARLIWLHTFGERFVPEGAGRGQIPRGSARCIKAVPGNSEGYPESFDYSPSTGTLHVGDGEFAPVLPAAYEFEVSGLKVVQSWLKYRMKKGSGRKSSPLDDIRPERWTSAFTTELLELLWVLEATVEGYPEQEALLAAVVAGPCFRTDELPPVPEAARRPPDPPEVEGNLFAD